MSGRILYLLRCDEIEDMGITRFAYGIDAYSLYDDGRRKLMRSVRDISSDRQALSRLIELCNKLSLSLIHMDDVIDDFIS